MEGLPPGKSDQVLRFAFASSATEGYRLNEKLVSGGAPNEGGLKQDAQAALDYLLTRPDVDPSQVFPSFLPRVLVALHYITSLMAFLL